MATHATRRTVATVLVLLAVSACSTRATTTADTGGRPRIVVTTTILGSVVSEVAGAHAEVSTLIPDGADPHEWSPSPRDVARLMDADLIVVNGRGAESPLRRSLDQARRRGTPVYSFADEIPSGNDPHIWLDPLSLRPGVLGLPRVLSPLGLSAGPAARRTADELADLDDELRSILDAVPQKHRLLVTGHDSLSLFADRFGLRVVGTVIPSRTTQAQVSARKLDELSDAVRLLGVKAVFTELGTPPAVVAALGEDTGARVIPLSTHSLGTADDYRQFMTTLASTIADGLTGTG